MEGGAEKRIRLGRVLGRDWGPGWERGFCRCILYHEEETKKMEAPPDIFCPGLLAMPGIICTCKNP
ncbi:hypothetical protein DWY69_27780, partial [Eisenbergiella massiliensis]